MKADISLKGVKEHRKIKQIEQVLDLGSIPSTIYDFVRSQNTHFAKHKCS